MVAKFLIVLAVLLVVANLNEARSHKKKNDGGFKDPTLPAGPCAANNLCPNLYVCKKGFCYRDFSRQYGPCGANNVCPGGFSCLEGFCEQDKDNSVGK